MIRLVPFLLVSLTVHAAFISFGANLFLTIPRSVGVRDGDRSRIFVAVVDREDQTAQAQTPAQEDSSGSNPSPATEEVASPEHDEQVSDTPERVEPKDCARLEAGPDPLNPPEQPTVSNPANQESEKKRVEKNSEAEREPKKKERQVTEPVVEAAAVASIPQAASEESRFKAVRGRDRADFREKVVAAIRGASYYPRKARNKRKHGQAMVGFIIRSDGSLASLKIIESSGSKLLDEAAANILRKAASRFPKIPESLSGNRISYVVPIIFKDRRSRKR